MSKKARVPRWVWIPQCLAAGILLWTGWHKLVGHGADIAIFQILEMEPLGRVAIGLLEVLSGLLLLSGYAALGASLAHAVMMGALIAHLTHLGVTVQGDGGLLLASCAAVLGSTLVVLWVRRAELPIVGSTL